MNHVKSLATLSLTCLLLLLLVAWAPAAKSKKVSSEAVEAVFQTAAPAASSNDQLTNTNMQGMVDQGRRIFRYDTFGDEAFWGGALNLQ